MAAFQDGVLQGAPPELENALQTQLEIYSNTSAGLLSHKQVLLLSRAFGLVPVDAQSVVRFFTKQFAPSHCECSTVQDPCPIAQVEEERNHLARQYAKVASLEELITLNARSVALSYVYSRRGVEERPHYHPVMCESIWGHFGKESGEAPDRSDYIWFDQLAKYQNSRCDKAWGKMGLIPYINMPVLAVLPLCTALNNENLEGMSLPLLGSRFPLDAYMQGALRKLALLGDSSTEESDRCEFSAKVAGLLGHCILKDALDSCRELYGVNENGSQAFPFISPWFRTWPMVERRTGILHKGLYMESRSWNVLLLVVTIMELLQDAAVKALENPDDPLVCAAENLVDFSYQQKIVLLGEQHPVQLLSTWSEEQVREYADLLGEVYDTLLAAQFLQSKPRHLVEASEALRKRVRDRTGTTVQQYSSVQFDWETLGSMCNCDGVLRFLRSSFVTHADCYTVADKVDMGIGLLRGLGGANTLAKLKELLFYENLGSMPLVGHETARARVVEVTLIAGSEKRENCIPFFSLSPLVISDTYGSWLKEYLQMPERDIVTSQRSILEKLMSMMSEVGGFVVRVLPDCSCKFIICSSAQLSSVIHSLSHLEESREEQATARKENIEILGTLHFHLFRDNAGGVIVILWLVERLVARGLSVLRRKDRVVSQLSWRRQDMKQEIGSDKDGAISWESNFASFKHEIGLVSPQVYEHSNAVFFWREGSSASGMPMADFFKELRDDMDELTHEDPAFCIPLKLL